MPRPGFRLPGELVVLLLVGLVATPARAATSASVVTAGGQLLSGVQADGQIGDLVLENDEIVVVISALGHLTHYGENGGTVIDAGTQAARYDALGELYTYFDDDWPRQAVYTSLVILDDGTGGGPAVIRAQGHDLNDPAMAVTTEYSLADGDRFLTLTTWVTGGGSIRPDFELGDAFQWGSCSKYAPGYGFSVGGTTVQAWMAGWSPEVCYAYGGTDGDCWGPNGNGWSDLSVTTATLDPVLPVGYTRFLSVTRGEIAAAVSVLHEAMGTPVGTLDCSVRSQADGSVLAGALVDVFDGSGNPHLQMLTDGSGQATADLPPGTWRARASLAGYTPREELVTVTVGGSHVLDFLLEPTAGGAEAVGDTLTVIQRPLVNIPALVLPAGDLAVSCAADPATTGWQAELTHGDLTLPLPVIQASHDPTTGWWTLDTTVPAAPLHGLYNLRVTADGGLDDTARDAVGILEAFRENYYFVHITDTHLPDHRYSGNEGGTPADSTEMVDLREVIADINLINPEFVVITGDYINEGELEDHLEWRAYTRAQRMLYEFAVPTFLVAGNHDLGGWDATPPPAGTARRNWWRFFGWPRLDDPPAGAPWYTQNYSFDYGPVHYVGLEAYNNYDSWREAIYGGDSFTSGQLGWLTQDLAAAAGSQAQVLFYHMDFQNQLNLSALGVEMALWGHIHSSTGDLTTMPFDLSTESVCDGARSYRLVRVSGGQLQPEPTLAAGGAGQNLDVLYTPSNLGLAGTVTAQVTNDLPQRFENGRLRFVMPAAGGRYLAAGGTLVQVDQSGVHDVCHVAVDIPAAGSAAVTVSPSVAGVPSGGAAVDLRLGQNRPNPFNPATLLEFDLPATGPARMVIYDLLGREIAVLVDETLEAGPHHARWEGRDAAGRDVPSGVYLVRLTTPDGETARKITLAR